MTVCVMRDQPVRPSGRSGVARRSVDPRRRRRQAGRGPRAVEYSASSGSASAARRSASRSSPQGFLPSLFAAHSSLLYCRSLVRACRPCMAALVDRHLEPRGCSSDLVCLPACPWPQPGRGCPATIWSVQRARHQAVPRSGTRDLAGAGIGARGSQPRGHRRTQLAVAREAPLEGRPRRRAPRRALAVELRVIGLGEVEEPACSCRSTAATARGGDPGPGPGSRGDRSSGRGNR